MLWREETERGEGGLFREVDLRCEVEAGCVGGEEEEEELKPHPLCLHVRGV